MRGLGRLHCSPDRGSGFRSRTFTGRAYESGSHARSSLGAGSRRRPIAGWLRPLGGDAIDFGWQTLQMPSMAFGNFYISCPPRRRRPTSFDCGVQLLQWTWKLTAIDLPEHVRVALAKELERPY